jgi:hypothetical protein
MTHPLVSFQQQLNRQLHHGSRKNRKIQHPIPLQTQHPVNPHGWRITLITINQATITNLQMHRHGWKINNHNRHHLPLSLHGWKIIIIHRVQLHPTSKVLTLLLGCKIKISKPQDQMSPRGKQVEILSERTRRKNSKSKD